LDQQQKDTGKGAVCQSWLLVAIDLPKRGEAITLIRNAVFCAIGWEACMEIA